jgi:hypothetical protein
MPDQPETMSVPITDGSDEPDTMSVPVDEPAATPGRTAAPSPTTAGGRTHAESAEPGQSLGRVPEHDDDDRDEAGDPRAGGPGTHGRAPLI